MEIMPTVSSYFQARRSKIVADVTSVAARPLSFFNLKGLSVKEAEQLLYGESALRFYEENYSVSLLDNSVLHSDNSNSLTLYKAVAEEKRLREILEELSYEKIQLSQELSQASIKTFSLTDILQMRTLSLSRLVDHAKDAIGECYAIRQKLDWVNEMYSQVCTRHAILESYLGYMRDVIAALKGLPITPIIEESHEQLLIQAETRAILNISLLRTDGLIHEKYVLGDPSSLCILRIIGGFSLEDLTRYNSIRECAIQDTLKAV